MAKKVVLPTNTGSPPNDTYVNCSKFIDMLQKQFPGKINFSISEVSQILNLSYDFVRENVLKNKIKGIKYGDRHMITIFELGRILDKGIE
ncbi:MAG: hypothetical protein KF816_02830 [Melioribacteraceae bacterium]|jgi:hypothetical protein|nr:hypothetical protein [Melioribacteraceae bacterium]